MANTPATGTGPFEFTDSQDRHVSIPLTAFSFDSNLKVVVDPAWSSVTGAQPAAALLAYALAEGLIAPAAAPAPFPAMIVKAADPGTGGNSITVTIANVVPAADPTATTFDITVTETDVYTGLTTASIESVLGSSAVAGSSPGGLVQVVHGSVDPAFGPTHTAGALSGSPAQLDVDGTGSPPRVFTLVAKKAGADGALTQIQVTPTSASPQIGPETFTLQASWTKTATAVTLTSLATAVASQLGYEITVALPGTGAYSVPAAAAASLSGGAPGVAASAAFFTGI